MEAFDLEVRPALRQGLREAEARGESVIALTDSDQVLALFALADQVRHSARAAVAQLKTLGMTPVMITGDAEAVAKTVADDLNRSTRDWHSEVLVWYIGYG